MPTLAAFSGAAYEKLQLLLNDVQLQKVEASRVLHPTLCEPRRLLQLLGCGPPQTRISVDLGQRCGPCAQSSPLIGHHITGIQIPTLRFRCGTCLWKAADMPACHTKQQMFEHVPVPRWHCNKGPATEKGQVQLVGDSAMLL